MRRRLAALVTLALASLLAGASPIERSDLWRPSPKSKDEATQNLPRALRLPGIRHWHYILRGVPQTYLDARAPAPRTRAVIEAGGRIYGQHCASCHGETGLGAQVSSQSLLPSPPLLAFMMQKPIAVDEYLLWSIADGGRQFDSGMPAFKDTLSREEIWAVIAYMRAGFPDTAK
ncbi:MAG: cytochrome c [Hyphomicrobiaceae bacterium]|nr:cytochrome c [Hyphomicrobiaceae bacterium]